MKCPHCGKSKAMKSHILVCKDLLRTYECGDPDMELALKIFKHLVKKRFVPTNNIGIKNFLRSRSRSLLLKYARWIRNEDVWDPLLFTDYITEYRYATIRKSIGNREMVVGYVKWLVKIEGPVGAAKKLAYKIEENDVSFLASPVKFCLDVSCGHVNPWILVLCKEGWDLLTSMSDEQISIIERFVNPVTLEIKRKAGLVNNSKNIEEALDTIETLGLTARRDI